MIVFKGIVVLSDEVADDLVAELQRTAKRDLPGSPLRRAALVCEEAGEALREALDATRGQGHDYEAEKRMYMELVQTVTMGLRVLTAMKREEPTQ